MQTNLTREKIPIASLPRHKPDVGFTGLFCQVRKASQLYIFFYLWQSENMKKNPETLLFTKGKNFSYESRKIHENH